MLARSVQEMIVARRRIVVLISLLLLAVEHPGVIDKDGDCTSCHANKTAGKSVHSAMAMRCTVCHVAWTRGDMTTVTLSMPKERICYSCHEQAGEKQLHKKTVSGQCVECHDAHASDRAMLLRVPEGEPLSALK
jgi:predicted CXXCH cytochrome family protein